MKILGTNALVLWSKRLDEVVKFYRTLGLPLEKEIHGEGPIHYACELGGTHFAIFDGKDVDAIDRGSSGCTQIGFEVSNVDEAFAVARTFGTKIVWEPRDTPWGRRSALICDPDGRPIELNRAL